MTFKKVINTFFSFAMVMSYFITLTINNRFWSYVLDYLMFRLSSILYNNVRNMFLTNETSKPTFFKVCSSRNDYFFVIHVVHTTLTNKKPLLIVAHEIIVNFSYFFH